MDASALMSDRGQYFVIKYRPTATRNEVRNIGVALVAESGAFGAVKHLPPSQLSTRLRAQGILDSALVGIGRLVGQDARGAIDRLAALSASLHGSIVLEPGMPADISSGPRVTLDAVFRALVVQRSARPAGVPRGKLLDMVVDTFRQTGTPVRRGEYVQDFLLDAVVDQRASIATAIHVQSFALSHRDWSRAERETGYFLHAADNLDLASLCVIQPPTHVSDDEARRSFERVGRLVARAGIQSIDPSELAGITPRFETTEQLPLIMA